MATDTYLLDRIRILLDSYHVRWQEKKMFGGDCFMVDDKMCFGTFRGGFMARVGPEEVPKLIKRPGAAQMFQGDRPMKGYIFVDPTGYDSEEALDFWIKKCLDFNPLAKAGKKRSSKN